MAPGFDNEISAIKEPAWVVSPRNGATDIRDKRREYAQAGIPEYWIVDPQSKTVTVLKLSGETYVVHGAYGHGDIAESALLDGFRVDIDDTWRAASGASSPSNH